MLGSTVKEIALNTYEDATTITKVLVENGYAVMTTREENLWIVNYVYSTFCGDGRADRNYADFGYTGEIVDDYNSESEEADD